MAVELLRSLRTGRAYARFVVEGHWDDREISVVGPFNDWTPGSDVLRPDRNGTRSALVEVSEGSDVQFRYLASGNDWFDDPDASEWTEQGSVVFWADAVPATAPAKKAMAKKAPAAKKAGPAKKAAPEPGTGTRAPGAKTTPSASAD
jgi:hypothetical protein